MGYQDLSNPEHRANFPIQSINTLSYVSRIYHPPLLFFPNTFTNSIVIQEPFSRQFFFRLNDFFPLLHIILLNIDIGHFYLMSFSYSINPMLFHILEIDNKLGPGNIHRLYHLPNQPINQLIRTQQPSALKICIYISFYNSTTA